MAVNRDKYESQFMRQMRENTGVSPWYKIILDFEKLTQPVEDLVAKYGLTTNLKLKNCFYARSFETVCRVAYEEPMAFTPPILTNNNYGCYELDLVHEIIKRERQKVAEGWQKIELEIEDDTMEMLEAYQSEYGMTFEEAVLDILKKFIETYKDKDE